MANTTMAGLRVDHLLVDLENLSFSVTTSPKFSWQIQSDTGCFQEAFRLVIGLTKKSLDSEDYVFDSDWINSKKSTAVMLGDMSNLERGKLYYWSVQVKTQAGEISEFAQPASFITEFAQERFDNISGIWAPRIVIEGKNELPALGTTVFLRSPHFELDISPNDRVFLTSVSRGNEETLSQSFDIFVNGTNKGFGSARPRPKYHGTEKTQVFYNSYEITDEIASDNVIAVKATGVDVEKRGFYGFVTVYSHDGVAKQVLETSSAWKALDGTAAYGDFNSKMRSLYFEMPEENVDLRYYPQGWMDTDFNDDSWKNAIENSKRVATDKEFISAYPAENDCRFELSTKYQQITKLDENDILIDLGKNIIGSLKVDLYSDFDQEVIVYSGEQLVDDGNVRHHLACGPDYVEKWTLVKGQNKFANLQMKNFRYIELKGFTGDISVGEVKGWQMRQPLDLDESYFISDNDLLNREYDMSKYTIQATNQDVYVDSQARERLPYEGDLLVNANTSYSVSSQYSLARHSIDWLLDNPTWPEDYKLFNVEMAWYDYMYTGDLSLLRDRYDVLKKKFLRGENETDNYNEKVGLVSGTGLIDWPIRERDGFIESTYNTPFNAIYVGVYRIMTKIAALFDKKEDVDFYRNRSNTIFNTLLTRLYDDETGRFYDSMNSDGTVNKHSAHHSSAYALCYQVYTDQKMADRLSEFVANDGEFIGSIYFIYFILKGLINGGHAEKALQLLTNPDDTKDKKTFAAILNTLKATIAPEAWSNYYKPNLTLSHPWGAAPGLTIIQGILGVQPTKPGFEEYEINLRTGDLKDIQAKVPSIKGAIIINYKVQGTETIVEIDSPDNTKGKLFVPQSKKLLVAEENSAIGTDEQSIMLNPGKTKVIFDNK